MFRLDLADPYPDSYDMMLVTISQIGESMGARVSGESTRSAPCALRQRLPRRRIVAGMLAAPLAGIGLSGCGGSSVLGQRSPDQLAMMNDNSDWVKGYRAAGHALAKRTGYKFNVNSISNNYNQLVKMSIQTKKVADVVKWQSGYPLTELVRGGRLAQLDEIWDRLSAKDRIDSSLRQFSTVDGHVYGLPLYKSHFAFFYSKSAFAKHHLHPPRSYDDLIEIAKTLKGHGITPFSAQYNEWNPMSWFEELVTKTDPEFYDALTSGQARYTDPTMIDVLRRWRDLLRRNWFTALDLDVAADCGPLLKQGKLGMVPYGTWISGSLDANGVKAGEDFGLFNLPPISRGTKPTVIVESGVLTLPTASPNHNAAMKVIGDWLAPSVQRQWSDYLQDSSANPHVEVKNPAVAELESQIKHAGAQPLQRFYESSPPQLVQTIFSDLSSFMLNPNTVHETARKMAAHAHQAWADWKLG